MLGAQVLGFVIGGSIAFFAGAPAPCQEATPSLSDGAEQATIAERFQPRVTRSEAIEDRMHASALFAEGRLLFRREAFADALARYERAYRYSGDAQAILAELVPLAFSINRLGEAARYALLAEPQTKIDPFVLRRLALYLTENNRTDDALRLYDRAALAEPGIEDQRAIELITWFETGRLRFLDKQYGSAAQAFENVLPALESEPVPESLQSAVDVLRQDERVTFQLMGEAFLEAGNLERAEQLLRRAWKDPDQAPMLAFHLARVALQAGQLDVAQERLDSYFASERLDAGMAPYELQGEVLEANGNRERLGERLESLRQSQPENVFLLYFIAEQLRLAGKLTEAETAYQRVMQVRPLLEAYRSLGELQLERGDYRALLAGLGDAALRMDGLESLQDVVAKVAAKPEAVTAIVARVGETVVTDDGNLTGGEVVGTALAAAAILDKADRQDLADTLYAAVIQQSPTEPEANRLKMAWAVERLIGGEVGKAAELFSELAQDDEFPNVGAVQFYLSAALGLDGQYDAALIAAERAATELPDTIAAQVRPGWVLFLAKRWDEARQRYLKVLERYGDEFGSPAIREAVRETKSTLSSIDVYLQEPARAEEWLEQVLDEFPGDIGALNDLGYLWAERGTHLQRALRMTRQAVEAQPENEAYRDSYGWALYRLKRYEDALEQLRKAAQADPPDGVVLDHLGDALLEVEGPEAAVEQWRRALEHLGDAESVRREQIQTKLTEYQAE